MPGISGFIGKEVDLSIKQLLGDTCIELKNSDQWLVGRRTIPKFLNDKPFYEDECYLVIIEGVILNRKLLETNYQANSFEGAIIAMYHSLGDTFFNVFRGSFSGVFYDKVQDKWLIFTDQIGDKQVFYTQTDSSFVFSWEPGTLISYRRLKALPVNVNTNALYMVLTYGFLLEDNTYSNEIKKLCAGHYILIDKGNAKDLQYHCFTNEPVYGKSVDEWIEDIDDYFRRAVKLQFDKDLEYGYHHITTLSGGLDSRMTVWVAHELGYTEQLNTTFSQSNYLDESIAKAIATDLKHEWLFKALDHGNFLRNIDPITQITYGGGSYAGLAHGKSLYDLVNFDQYGIMHTGQIGDAILGTFYKKPEAGLKHTIGDGAYSLGLIDRLSNYNFKYSYANVEQFLLYTRAFTGANQGLLIFQEHTESISPFTDVDFINLCYSIPVEFRFGHKLYIDWILKKYPGAAAYPWEKIKDFIKPVKPVEMVNFLGKKIPKGKVSAWFIGVLKRKVFKNIFSEIDDSLSSNQHMNPMQYWLSTNNSLRGFLDDYFQKHITLIADDSLREDHIKLYTQGSISEKFQVLTSLSGLSLILQ